jgi:hypothetical protein
VSEPSPFVPIEALSPSDLVREIGPGFVDVTIRVRVILPEKQKYPVYNMPYLRVKIRNLIDCRNVLVLKELSMTEGDQGITFIRM